MDLWTKVCSVLDLTHDTCTHTHANTHKCDNNTRCRFSVDVKAPLSYSMCVCPISPSISGFSFFKTLISKQREQCQTVKL